MNHTLKLTTQAPATTTEAPAATLPPTTQAPATTVPPTTTATDCDCLPQTHPEYVAAKAAWEAARDAANASWPAVQEAADEYLAAVRAARPYRDCGCRPDLYQIMDEKEAAYKALRAAHQPLVEEWNRALEEYDRVRDVAQFNTP